MSDGGWFDAEAIESERQDADQEMAALYAAGRRASRNQDRVKALIVAGHFAKAAALCTHGWSGPRSGMTWQEGGIVCYHCGSQLANDDARKTVLAPCAFLSEIS